MRGNSHVRCEAGEKVEITSKPYLSLLAQLHKLGIKGIKPWNSFYKTIETFFINSSLPAEYHFYGANVPKKLEPQRYELREKFFRALIRDGISVHKGFVVQDHEKKFISKGVDVLLSLDLVDLSLEGYDEIYVFSADGDIVPAIQRARENGTIVKAIVSFDTPAKHMVEAVDEVIRLSDVLKKIPSNHILRQERTNARTFKKESVA
ncbi:hypothetical protein PBF_19668 [Cytobacillus firmus DS1]|uniref:NYN domain-containing protein n=1 Tax=Cytobacillus firmus DS1 TaxID=1307436 RepID=W7KSZ8_CYTFI|nr:hypothetical protein PBF_19668 [Cytobacillus firmus DS1]